MSVGNYTVHKCCMALLSAPDGGGSCQLHPRTACQLRPRDLKHCRLQYMCCLYRCHACRPSIAALFPFSLPAFSSSRPRSHSNVLQRPHNRSACCRPQDELCAGPLSPAAAALGAALTSAAAKVGAVHLALHATPSGLVTAWRSDILALAEPSADADALARDIACSAALQRAANAAAAAEVAAASGDGSSGGVPGALLAGSRNGGVTASAQYGDDGAAFSGRGNGSGDGSGLGGGEAVAPPSLSALCSSCSRFELQDGSVLTLLTKQEVHAPGGPRVASFMFQRLSPAGWLTAPQLAAMMGQWQQQLVVSSGWLPPALTAALLVSGVRAVVAADRWGASAAAPPAALAAFFRAFYRALTAGRPVLASLEAAETAHPELRGCFHLWSA